MSTYYRTCPDCGCNLDPGEICDCKKELKPLDNDGFLKDAVYSSDKIVEETIPKKYSEAYPTSDVLIVGYDRSKGRDTACLTIARRNCDRIIILKEFIGTEAIKEYEKLVMGSSIRQDPQMADFLKKNFNIPR